MYKQLETLSLKGIALDWAVAKCECDELAAKNIQYPEYAKHYQNVSPSTNWMQGGPIIEREGIAVGKSWNCWKSFSNTNSNIECSGPTPLIAAMRCYVIHKLGALIEVPEELLQ